MYNSVTTDKIKNIPSVGDIDIDRLPEELTRIYAQIISLRRKVADGTINLEDENLLESITLLQGLSSNLETLLLVNPDHNQKESIAFVAATAHTLIYKMGVSNDEARTNLDIDYISSYLAAIVLFLIGNSQADAAETAKYITDPENTSITQRQLINSLSCLATGKLSELSYDFFQESEALNKDDFEETALNFLWREIGLGIIEITKRLLGQDLSSEFNHFDRVIDLTISEEKIFDQYNVLAGPRRLAKLLNILKGDILSRAIINIGAPLGVDSTPWQSTLVKIAKTRPYLWENHKEAVETNFLNPGTSAILTFPTGAGKSTLSELKIASSLYSGKRVVYLVPTHALEDQVNRNLKKIFTEFGSINIKFDGEYTDLEEIEDFPILVMTPERCLTLININSEFFSSIGLVVFDEFHLIHGTDIKKDRRAIDAMYCLLSLFNLIPKADYLLISAMVENGEEIRSWVEKLTERDCVLFNSNWKPTRQLHGCLAFKTEDINELTQIINTERKAARTFYPSAALKRRVNIEPQCLFSLKNIWETTDTNDYFISKILDSNVTLGINNFWRLTPNRNEVAATIGTHFASLGLKTLVFVDTPKIAESTARKIEKAFNLDDNNFSSFIERNKYLIDNLTLELGSFQHSYFFERNNVGIHHGGLLPVERELIESYFKNSNGASALVATATLAQGINLPAEIVIIAGDDRFDINAGSRESVKPHDLLNAAGRAGRAGQSSQGAVILIPGEIVTINNLNISNRWWQLKNEVFSKGDQCLKIEDPLEYFLDSLEESADSLNSEQINILYRFKSEKISASGTENLLKKSFYAHMSSITGTSDKFSNQLNRLLDARNELESQSDEGIWYKEISYKTGLEPSIILELSDAIENSSFDDFIAKPVPEIIDWFINWLKSNESYFERIIVNPRTRNQIKKTIGLRFEQEYPISEIISNLHILTDILQNYISGQSLKEINELIPDSTRPDSSPYLKKARNFVLRLIPDLSFYFGIISLITTEKANQKGMIKSDIAWDIRVLSSCIREGVDSSEKLFYKKNNNIPLRVAAHVEFNKQ